MKLYISRIFITFGNTVKCIISFNLQLLAHPSCGGNAEIGFFRCYATDHSADLVVIGSGPGGYVGAIKAAQLGMRVRVKIFIA